MAKQVDLNTSHIKVSIVTPVFNCQDYLADTIQSVLNQTHQNWELLITDDCSWDQSWDISKKFAVNEDRIQVKRLAENSGAAVARNVSIERSQGHVVAFLDGDDIWDPIFLEKSLRVMEEKQAGIVFSSYRRCSEDLGEDLGEFIVPETTTYRDMLKSCPISCLTGIYHVERCRGKVMMPDIRRRQDYCMWLTLLKRVPLAYGIKDVLATYRICKHSVSRNKVKAARYQWLVYRRIEHLTMISSLYYFLHYMIRGSIKNYAILRVT